MTNRRILRLVGLLFFLLFTLSVFAKHPPVQLHYQVSISAPSDKTYQVQLSCSNWQQNTVVLKMPEWMPGYYQLMHYASSLEGLAARNSKGKSLQVEKISSNTWKLSGIEKQGFTVNYTIRTSRQFVANSWVDTTHAYLVPANSFLYIDHRLDLPVKLDINTPARWTKIATGLEPVTGRKNSFTASDFDILYDCPILIGDLQELPSFTVNGVQHRFIGYKMGHFDQTFFMQQLKRMVEAAVAIIGDIPFKEYTFIGIGPGRGGIEHLNNTTISFDGSDLHEPAAMNTMLKFLAHEYFHHYNVKRIRPFELGPFDYEKGNRTNLLWISEGLTVYYEYLILSRAGLIDANTLFNFLSDNLNAVQNNPGRYFQSLQQASYYTWKDGPFGTTGPEPGKSISYYDKGPIVGLIFDLSIRNATQNKKSLDDVMRYLYQHYYKESGRGFTEAEFQFACEEIAGKSLTGLFEFVYTTKEMELDQYLSYAGLELQKNQVSGKEKWQITRIKNPDQQQQAILASWTGLR